MNSELSTMAQCEHLRLSNDLKHARNNVRAFQFRLSLTSGRVPEQRADDRASLAHWEALAEKLAERVALCEAAGYRVARFDRRGWSWTYDDDDFGGRHEAYASEDEAWAAAIEYERLMGDFFKSSPETRATCVR